jgi:hypothetical protein
MPISFARATGKTIHWYVHIFDMLRAAAKATGTDPSIVTAVEGGIDRSARPALGDPRMLSVLAAQMTRPSEGSRVNYGVLFAVNARFCYLVCQPNGNESYDILTLRTLTENQFANMLQAFGLGEDAEYHVDPQHISTLPMANATFPASGASNHIDDYSKTPGDTYAKTPGNTYAKTPGNSYAKTPGGAAANVVSDYGKTPGSIPDTPLIGPARNKVKKLIALFGG